MAIDKIELQKKASLALAAIKMAHGTDDDEYGATLFTSHHLEDIESEYWNEHFKTEKPSAVQILDSLILRPSADEEESIDSLDFTLPGDITNYVICVYFDEDGEVEDISMES